MPWTPIVSNEKDAELPYTPLEAAMNGKFKKCPIILGTVANESVQFVWGVQPKPMPKIEFDLFVETLFGLKFGEEVLKLYGPPPANETKDTRYFLSILGTDYIFKCPNRYAAKGYSQKVDTYMLDLLIYYLTIRFYKTHLFLNAMIMYAMELICQFYLIRNI